MSVDQELSEQPVELDLELLPPARLLSVQLVALGAKQIATFFKFNLVNVYQVGQKLFVAETDFYDIKIEATTAKAVREKSVCPRYWKGRLENKSNIDRLNWEAGRRLVGGPSDFNKPMYCSDATLRRYQEKSELTKVALEKIKLLNLKTSEVFSMADLAKSSAARRLSELYFVAKNLELMAKSKHMSWLFVTFTAPPEYHPNPTHQRSKNTYRKELGPKSSHEYIRDAWGRIRAYLNKKGLQAGAESYFGFRTAETHKDGSVHWHLQVFLRGDAVANFISACEREFSLKNQVKFVLGDDKKGSASSYIFKYLVKEVDFSGTDSLPVAVPIEPSVDEERERQDLASIRNGYRVKAALRSMNVRQYQLFGIGGVMTLLREINKIDFESVAEPLGDLAFEIKSNVWRSPEGLKNLISILGRTNGDGKPAIHLVKESAKTTYGESRTRVVGVTIDAYTFRSTGRYRVIF
ncbi:hypothetical protein A0O30_17240 [Pseudomonas sp. LLC-1]|uniref:replication endonuclease n=1 Tax=Pseudomonas sp. LLC-1 TaxID=1812180 RepID=UPI000D01FF34|nr:replication endonuclease [Pseudomonas sp. LLC-1]PRN03575.1 hypothetical protein A0O30_17240 [Pseudomonas sp. LLC-1]